MKEENNINLFESDSLHHLFFQILRLHHHRSHMLFDKIGLYPGQPQMLIALYHKDGQSQTELGNRRFVKPATITVMLNRMEKERLVERRQDPEDQRVSRVYLTDHGREICKKVNQIFEKMELEIFNNFTDEERVLLRRFLIQMRDNLKEVSGKNYRV